MLNVALLSIQTHNLCSISCPQHNTTQHNTARHNTAQHNTAQHNTAQHSTAQHSTAQHNTTQHNTAQHNTVWTSLWTSTMGLVWGIVAVYLVQTASPP